MPNWCSNSMSISGPKEKIKALWEKAKSKDNQPDQPSLLEAMVPIGEWEYGTAVDAWGTKWDISLEGLEYEEDGDTASISGWFDSAWSPPIEAFKTYCNLNEDVSAELSFFEPGVGFVGRWDNGNGEDYYDIDPDELDDIPEDLREEWNIDSWYEEDEEEGDDKSV